jgi:hypothetical protein
VELDRGETLRIEERRLPSKHIPTSDRETSNCMVIESGKSPRHSEELLLAENEIGREELRTHFERAGG